VLARMDRPARHMFASSVIVGDLDVDRPVRSSLIRMLYWPLRSPRRGSNALPGRAARSCRLVAASSRSSRFSACRAKPENSLTRSPLAKRSVLAFPVAHDHLSRNSDGGDALRQA
jgi:hypothetical protein